MNRSLGLHALRLVVLCFALLTPLASAAASEAPAAVRAIWITRFDYKTEADVRNAIRKSIDAGFNRIMFQVRGNATAFYPSKHEPWAEQLGWKDPGFDPLAVALELAHARGVELHAWVNVYPAWWGTRPPENPKHVFHTKPEWFWYDRHGNRQALSFRFYVSLNPCLPEVQDYLTEVIGELPRRYAIDGLHLDYLRFPNEPPATPAGSGIDYPRDEVTLARFKQATGKAPESAPEAWNQWRSEQVTELLRRIRKVVKTRAPQVALSVAVGPDPELALTHFQDYRQWLREDLVDALYPMNYTANRERFTERLTRWRVIDKSTPIVMGLMLGSGDIEQRAAQLQSAQEAFDGYCVFAYSALFDSPNVDIDTQDEQSRALRRARRQRFVPFDAK